MITIRKRNNLYGYRFEAGKVNGKRNQITKSVFKTKRYIKFYQFYVLPKVMEFEYWIHMKLYFAEKFQSSYLILLV